MEQRRLIALSNSRGSGLFAKVSIKFTTTSSCRLYGEFAIGTSEGSPNVPTSRQQDYAVSRAKNFTKFFTYIRVIARGKESRTPIQELCLSRVHTQMEIGWHVGSMHSIGESKRRYIMAPPTKCYVMGKLRN
jgi:hypothetical protein